MFSFELSLFKQENLIIIFCVGSQELKIEIDEPQFRSMVVDYASSTKTS